MFDSDSALLFLSGRCKKASRGLQGGAIREEKSPSGCQNLYAQNRHWESFTFHRHRSDLT